jgi:hypothetical protein
MEQHIKLQYVIESSDGEWREAAFEFAVAGSRMTLQSIFRLCWGAVDGTPWVATDNWTLLVNNRPIAIPQWSLRVLDGKCPSGFSEEDGGQEITEWKIIKPFMSFTKEDIDRIEKPPYEENNELFWVEVVGDHRGVLAEHPAKPNQHTIELRQYI